jgi:HlyD family secretion protein
VRTHREAQDAQRRGAESRLDPGRTRFTGKLPRAQGEPLQAEVQLHNEDVGFVSVGQLAKVKVAAYPFQKYGLLDGRVILVSADAADPKQQQQPPQQPGQPQLNYRAIVQIDTPVLTSAATGEKLTLNPGMAVTAEVQQGRRSVIEYLLSPVKKVAQEAARER